MSDLPVRTDTRVQMHLRTVQAGSLGADPHEQLPGQATTTAGRQSQQVIYV